MYPDSPMSTFPDRTFEIGIFAYLKLNGIATYHVLKLFMQKNFALICTYTRSRES